jgi:hypothetical protein
LADITVGLASADSVHGTLTALLATPIGSPGVVAAAVGVLDQATQQVMVHYGDALDGQMHNGDAVVADPPTPILEVLRTGRPVIKDDLPESGAQNEKLSRGVSAIRAAPFPLRDSSATVIGAIALLWRATNAAGWIDLVGDIAIAGRLSPASGPLNASIA